MKSRTIFLAVCLVTAACLAASCRKYRADQSAVPVFTPAGTNITKDLGNTSLAETQQALEGKWHLLGSGGGLTGGFQSAPKGIYHVFGKSVFTINDNGTVKDYPCTWESIKSIHSGYNVYQLNYKGGASMSFLRVINDTLYTSDNMYDGYGSTYIKIK